MEVTPGNSHIVKSAANAVKHGAPVIDENIPGVAFKQITAPAGIGLGDSKIDTVQAGEQYAIVCKGRVYVANSRQEGGAFARGDAVYIRTSDNLLTAATTGNKKFGVCVEIAGNRGVGTGKMRVDLDLKSTL